MTQVDLDQTDSFQMDEHCLTDLAVSGISPTGDSWKKSQTLITDIPENVLVLTESIT